MQSLRRLLVLALPAICAANANNESDVIDWPHRHHHKETSRLEPLPTQHHGHHHGHQHKGHRHHHDAPQHVDKAEVAAKPSAAAATPVLAAAAAPVVQAAVQAGTKKEEANIVDKMKKLEAKIAEKQAAEAKGHLLVNGPLPADFNERFAQAVAQATGTDANKVKVTGSSLIEDSPGVVEVSFTAPRAVVKAVESDAADPDSKLAKGNLHSFLVADEKVPGATHLAAHRKEKKEKKGTEEKEASKAKAGHHHHHTEQDVTPVEEKGIDIDTSMPYGDLEPFGREDTAQELTESSVRESDGMVDQLERAEVAEEKRSVFRALTRLRGAAITSFDGVARSQTGNIDEYNKVHKWRHSHPLHHLADEESDIHRWAFPDNADF